jgi:hypothetical protein
MPPKADTLPAMIQLHLYKWFFDCLTATESDDGLWDEMFKQEGLRTYQPFSEDFVVQALMIIESNDMGHMPGILEARCLGELVAVWRKTVEEMGIASVGSEDELKIVYRKNETTVKGKRKAKKQKLGKGRGKGKGKLKPLHVDAGAMDIDQGGASSAGTNCILVFDRWLMSSPAAPSSVEGHPSSSESECPSDGDSDIIGVKCFTFDGQFLDQHLKASLDFWKGIQEAKGVGIENTRRCK